MQILWRRWSHIGYHGRSFWRSEKTFESLSSVPVFGIHLIIIIIFDTYLFFEFCTQIKSFLVIIQLFPGLYLCERCDDGRCKFSANIFDGQLPHAVHIFHQRHFEAFRNIDIQSEWISSFGANIVHSLDNRLL